MYFEWSQYTKLIASLIQEWNERHKIPDGEIFYYEKSLNIKFPQYLLEFYKSWGNHQELVASKDYIIDLDSLWINNNHLVFACENQATYYWGIPINNESNIDPPVRFSYGYDDLFDWVEIYPKFSMFLDAFGFGHIFSSSQILSGYGIFDNNTSLEFALSKQYDIINLDSHVWRALPNTSKNKWTIYSSNQDSLIMTILEDHPIARNDQSKILLIKSKSKSAINAISNLDDLEFNEFFIFEDQDSYIKYLQDR